MSAARALGLSAGIAAVVRCALAHPPRLGSVRLIAVDGPSGSGKSFASFPLAQALAEAIGGVAWTAGRPDDGEWGRTGMAGAGPLKSAGIASGAGDSGAGDSGAGDSGAGDSGAVYLPQDPGQVHSVRGGLRRVAVVSTDLVATWEDPFGWWPIWEEHLLGPLSVGKAAGIPFNEWVDGRPGPGGHLTVPPVDVLVLEGVSSGRRAVAERLSALLWVEVPDAALRLERAVARDGESERANLKAWQVDEAAHFALDETRLRADIVIDPR